MSYRDIECFLQKYYSLFQEIHEYTGGPDMDADTGVIDDPDFCGVDMSDEQKVFQLFFSGDCTYFPAIPLHGNALEDIHNLDEWPVYVVILEESAVELCGNFRTYIENIFKEYQNAPESNNSELLPIVANALSDLETFSTRLIKKPYSLKFLD